MKTTRRRTDAQPDRTRPDNAKRRCGGTILEKSMMPTMKVFSAIAVCGVFVAAWFGVNAWVHRNDVETVPMKAMDPISTRPERTPPLPEPWTPTPTVRSEFAVPSSSATRVFEVTGYCSCSTCCGKNDGITRSGEVAGPGTVAAPESIPFGTKIVVPGYGTGVVRDRGGAIVDGKLDVWFRSHTEARRWGRRIVECEVVQ